MWVRGRSAAWERGTNQIEGLGPIRCRHVDGTCPREPGGVETTAEREDDRSTKGYRRRQMCVWSRFGSSGCRQEVDVGGMRRARRERRREGKRERAKRKHGRCCRSTQSSARRTGSSGGPRRARYGRLIGPLGGPGPPSVTAGQSRRPWLRTGPWGIDSIPFHPF